MGVADLTLFVPGGTCRGLGRAVGGSGSLWQRGRDRGKCQDLVHWRSLAIPLGLCRGPLDSGVGYPESWVVMGRGLAWSSSSWGFGIPQPDTASWGGVQPRMEQLWGWAQVEQSPSCLLGMGGGSLPFHWACGGRR